MTKNTKESILLQVYIIPFYFLLYMMFFYDPISTEVWAEKDFNATVKYKMLYEIAEIFGEPTQFEVRENVIVLDYYDLVYPKERSIRYQFVRLIFFKGKGRGLIPSNIYYMK